MMPVEIDVLLEMRGKAVERLVDAGLVVEAAARSAQPRQPFAALAIVGKQPVDVGA